MKLCFRIAQNLKIMKTTIMLWHKEERRESMCTQSLFQDIETIDRKEGDDIFATEDLVCIASLKFESANRLHMEEISW